jgi:KUP system potassium uptake protein
MSSHLRDTTLGVAFIGIDTLFLCANGTKFMTGGYFPLLLGCGLIVCMTVWSHGQRKLRQLLDQEKLSVEAFVSNVAQS